MGNNSFHKSTKRKIKSNEINNTKVNYFDEGNVMDYYDKRDYLYEENTEHESIEILEQSPIQKFYKGKNILITGASGFIGTLLLEKLLRCTDINKIYILFRNKKSQYIQERMIEYFHDDIFDELKKINKNFINKVIVIPSDLQIKDLGISKEHTELIINEVDIIFHVAATVKFDEHLRISYEINVKGTEYLLNLAEKIINLKSFVYVSTAYSNCDRRNIDEKFYEPTYTHEELEIIMNHCTDEEISICNEIIMKPKPNTYTLTKHTCEDLVKKRMKILPIGIFRPSIVLPTDNDPMPMWSKGMTGLTAMYIAVGLGVMRTVYQRTSNLIDIVPGDFVVNAIITVGWEIGNNKKFKNQINKKNEINYKNNENDIKNTNQFYFINKDKEIDNFSNLNNKHNNDEYSHINSNYVNVKQIENEKNINSEITNVNIDNNEDDDENQYIYNMVSGADNPITLGKSTDYTIYYNNISEEGTKKSLWIIHHNPTNSRLKYICLFYIYNILPTLLFFEFLERLSGKPKLMKLYRKVFFLNKTIENFSTKEWIFTTYNTRNLFNKLNNLDKKIFNFNIKTINWKSYHSVLYRGIAKYALDAPASKYIYNTRIKYMALVDTLFFITLKIIIFIFIYYNIANFILYYINKREII